MFLLPFTLECVLTSRRYFPRLNIYLHFFRCSNILECFLTEHLFYHVQYPCCSLKGEPPSKRHHSAGHTRHPEENYGRREEL